VNAPGHGLFDLEMTILTCGIPLQVPHAIRTRFMAVDALDLLADVDILRQTRGL